MTNLDKLIQEAETELSKKYGDFKFHHKKLPCFTDYVAKSGLYSFIESHLKKAYEEGRLTGIKECIKDSIKTSNQ